MKKILSVALLFAATSVHATVFQLSLDGIGGQGMLPTNENHFVNAGGTGGIGGAGLSYDSNSGILSLDIEWGSGNGFTDLSGAVTGAHIHGPTASDFGFNENAGVLYDISAQPGLFLSTGATDGAIFGSFTIMPGDEDSLLAGKLYVNVHTALNAAGEIRGQLVPVPEPQTTAIVAGLLCVAWARLHRGSKRAA